MLPALKYTVLRLGLFVAALGLLILLGASQLVALVLAALVSALLSYVLLRRPREELSRQIAGKVDQRLTSKHPLSQDEAVEDAATETARPTPTDEA